MEDELKMNKEKPYTLILKVYRHFSNDFALLKPFFSFTTFATSNFSKQRSTMSYGFLKSRTCF